MSAPKVAERAYTLEEAAALKSVSVPYLRKQIKRTEAPVLEAKKVGKSYRISASALEAFWDALPDG